MRASELQDLGSFYREAAFGPRRVPSVAVFAFSLAALASTGCAVFKGQGDVSGPSASAARKSESVAAPVDDDLGSEEAGIDGITQRLKQFNRALGSKDFERAGRLLRRAELAIQNADELTRGHPEFDDKVDSAERAKVRFEQALERDRIERRNAAIAELIDAGDIALKRGRTIFAAMRTRVPTEDDIEALGQVLERLNQLRGNGKQYADHAQYRVHAEDRDAQTNALRDRLKVAQWQVATSEYLNAPIVRGGKARKAARSAKKKDKEIAALKTATDAFKQCVDHFKQLSSRPDYDGERLVKTAFGAKDLKSTRKECESNYQAISSKLAVVQWETLVTTVLSNVNSATRKFNAEKTARGKLEARPDLEAALTSCVRQMNLAKQRQGYDKRKTFQSPFGELNVPGIERSCSKRAESLKEDKPSLIWQAEFEGFAQTLEPLPKAVAKANSETTPAAQALEWQNVAASFEACAQAAKELGEKKSKTPRFQAKTAYGPLTIRGVETECDKRLAAAKASLDKAQSTKKLNAFLKTVKGDEVAVARKEGIPSRIESVSGGRVFHYERKGAPDQQFGFDSKGSSVDFDKQWREGFQKIARDVTGAMSQIESAKTGADLRTAVQAALPKLRDCASQLENAEKLPGAAPKMKQKTTFGELQVTGLKRACDVEMRKQRSRLPAIDWQIKLEATAARAREAERTINANRQPGPAKPRIDAIGRALGSFEECVEAAEALEGQPGASETLLVPGPERPVTRKGLITACTQAKSVANTVLEAARADLELQTFIEKAKGDERAVAKRDGLPTQVESIGTGRVFVYRKGGKEKRIAFDAEGRRVSESSLRASGGEARAK